MSFSKRVLAVIAGVAVGLTLVMAGDFGSGILAPFLKEIDYTDKQKIAEAMTRVPLSAFLVMLLGYSVGAFLGGLVATLISGREASRPAITVGIILTVGNIFNQMSIPHPMWFSVVSTLIYIPFAWLGYRLMSKPSE